jgi:hypothetical protein
MSLRGLRWLLWIGLVITLPLPYFAIEPGRIPAVQLFLFAALVVPLMVSDLSLTTGVLGSLFATQALFYGAVLWFVAGWLSERIPPTRRGAALIGVMVGLLLLAALPVYVAPLSYGIGSTNWRGLWP